MQWRIYRRGYIGCNPDPFYLNIFNKTLFVIMGFPRFGDEKGINLDRNSLWKFSRSAPVFVKWYLLMMQV